MLAVHAIVPDEIAFSDSVSYLTYVDNLYFFRASDWFVFEPFSKLILLILRATLGRTETTIAAAHYFISAIFLIGALAVFPPSQGNWRGLVMAFALYGPQLAFVTIRATPAYFIAAAAVIEAIRGNKRAFPLVALAVAFHISSVLALIPILTLFAVSNLKSFAFLKKTKPLIISLGVMTVAFGLVGSLIFQTVSSIFQNIPFLGKYLVFAVGMSDSGGVGGIVSGFAVGHFVLLLSITLFTFLFLLVKDQVTKNIGFFVIISYLFYSFTFFAFSPIAAFRQTPFWMLPAFAVFPWPKIGWRGIGHAPFIALAVGIFAFQFSRVI